MQLVKCAASWASSPGRRANMRAIHSRDTAPELALRRMLYTRGLQYRVATRPLKDVPRKAAIVYGPTKVAVFVDGCVLPRCPDHAADINSNPDYWQPKQK